MTRCDIASASPLARARRSSTRVLSALLVAAAAATLAVPLPAAAQAARQFPQNALRGLVAFDAPPALRINGQPARLAPGARIHGTDNMLKMSASLAGTQAVSNYVRERGTGLVQEVWVLRADEAARQPWPVSEDQTKAWTFDPAAQAWTKP